MRQICACGNAVFNIFWRHCGKCMYKGAQSLVTMVRWLTWCLWRRRRRCRCGPILFFSVVGIVSFFISVAAFAYAFRHWLFDTFVKCSDKESLDFINEYCDLYREGKIVGSLCRPLCDSYQVEFSTCTDFHAGKQVNIMSCTDFCVPGQSVSAVLKYPRNNISMVLSETPDFDLDEMHTPQFLNYTRSIIHDLLHSQLGVVLFPPDTDLIALMWDKDYEKYTKSKAERQIVYRTIMMLMDQSEYLTVKALGSSGVVPQIYGSCGPLYLEESCPPGVLDEATQTLLDQNYVKVPWKQKVGTILQLLYLVRQLEENFPEVLHLCDVKGTNFGVCQDGSVKLIDADTVFFHSRMMETFLMDKCETNGDCNFFDCGGWCLADTGKCEKVITNNNLQKVCRDVISNDVPEILGGGSMFSNAPASIVSKLNAILNECLTQTSEERNHIPVYKPPLSLLNRLIHLLIQSMAQKHNT